MFGYRVPRPDEAMLISGGKGATGGTPFKVVMGHGAFVWPGFRKAGFLTLSMFEATVSEPCTTKQGIQLKVDAVIAAKVAPDPQSIVNAAQRFLSDQRQMSTLTGRIFAGHLRSIVGSMTVEELITERQKLASEVLDASKAEMALLGLVVDALQISSISDGDQGYIKAMAAPHQAAIQQAAQIAEAEAQRASADATQQSARAQAEYQRDTEIARAQYAANLAAEKSKAAQIAAQAEQEQLANVAQYQAVTAAAQAKASQTSQQAEQEQLAAVAAFQARTRAAQAESEQAGPLAAAKAKQQVTTENTKLAQLAVALRQQQLQTEVVAPADAEAQRIKALADAEAYQVQKAAEAAASSNRVSLDQRLIELLPDMVANAAAGLAGANVTLFNGAEGMEQVLTQVVGQGLSVFQTIKDGLGQAHQGQVEPTSAPSVDGKSTRRAVAGTSQQ